MTAWSTRDFNVQNEIDAMLGRGKHHLFAGISAQVLHARRGWVVKTRTELDAFDGCAQFAPFDQDLPSAVFVCG